MNLPLIIAAVWVIVATVAAAFPSKRKHWPLAYVLIATGLPILVWIWMTQAWWISVIATLGAASILRWPLIYFLRWLGVGRQQ